MFNKGATDWFKFLVAGILILVGIQFLAPGTLSGIFGTTTTTTTPTTPGTTPSGYCSTEDVTVTLDAVEEYTNGAMSGSNFYYVNGGQNGAQQSVTDAGTFTASPGDTIDVYFQLESPMHYTKSKAYTIPCKGTFIARENVYRHESNGGAAGAVTPPLTVRIFTQDNGDLNTILNNESLAAGDLVTLKMEIQGNYERGMPYGATVACDGNGSLYDKIEMNGGGITTAAAVPTLFNGRNLPQGKKWAFKLPPIISNQEISGSLVIDVCDAATCNPFAHQLSSIYCELYDWDYFTTDTGAVAGPGPEDTDDWSDVGNTTVIFYANNVSVS